MDHELQAQELHDARLRAMSPAEKLRQLNSLLAFAWSVKRGALAAQHPAWSGRQLDAAAREAFLYGRT
ncbi:MAG: hypothetical protein HY903_08610 [Deltaproteobacteria bacterium]|nr:hypothetical protein [Deltaproteobacteria bacterium]